MKTLLIFIVLLVSSTTIFAQKARATKPGTEKTNPVNAKYNCPMHHEVITNEASMCSKCMKEVVVVERRSSKQGRVIYTCAMHPNVVANEAGQCPKCGMALEGKK